MSFEVAFREVILKEGGYANNPYDSGGKTMYGITERVARANGYNGEMRDMALDTAKRIYKRQYWDTLRLDDVAALSDLIAYEMFDTGVNMGIGRAAEYLQRALNVFNRRQALWADMKVDRAMGPITLAALGAFLRRRGLDGQTVMLRTLNGLQTHGYVDIAERREKDEEFVYGQILQRVVMP